MEDPHKSQGELRLRIENVREFAQQPDTKLYSNVVYIYGLAWRIVAKPIHLGQHIWLSYFIQCNAGSQNTDWTCEAMAYLEPGWRCEVMAWLRIMSQDDKHDDHVHFLSPTLNRDKCEFGHSEYMRFEDILDPSLGLYDADTDSIRLFARVSLMSDFVGIKMLSKINFVFPKNLPPLSFQNAAIVEAQPKDQVKEAIPNQSRGHIVFKLNKFRELAQRNEAAKMSKLEVNVRGLPWHICVNIHDEKYFDIYLACRRREFADWECNVSATLKLCSNKAGQCSKEFSFQKVFHSKSLAWGCLNFMELQTLLDPENGWIDQNTITLEANFTVNSVKGINDLLRNAATETITVDGNNIKVNKHQLAMHSTYFERLFFSNNFPEKDTIQLQPPANFTHFCRMLAALPPENRPLDDNCIEGVLHLADRFMLNEVEGKCRLFLVEQSKKPALFKFRLAAKYGWTGLKEQILSDLTKDDFDSSKFYQNLDESDKMDQDSANAVRAAHARLFGTDNEGPPAKRARN